MTSLFEILKTSKRGMAPDLFTALLAEKFGYTPTPASQQTKTGAPPIYFISDGTPLIAYSIIGNMEQTGTPSSSSPIYPSETGERTENLWNDTLEQGAISASTGQPSSADNRVRSENGIRLSSGTYTISTDSDKWIVSRIYNLDGTYKESGGVVANPLTFTLDSDSLLKFIIHYKNDRNLSPSDVSQIMLNTGSTPKPYEPYGYKLPVVCGGSTTNIYLSEPIRNKGNYADTAASTGVATRKIKKLVLTGEESGWFLSGTNSYGIANYGLPNALESFVSNNPVCSHFVYQVTLQNDTKTEGIFTNAQLSLYVRVTAANLPNKTAFTNWLKAQYANGTPVTVWYILTTPTTETFTAPTISTIEGEQTFDIDTTLKPSEVTIEYMGW